jgi:hypothetical protein
VAIPLYPKLPAALIAAAAAGRVVPFIGSGVSRNCGSPDWTGFAAGAIEQALRVGLVSDAEHAAIATIPSARTQLSILSQREEDRKIWLDYPAILHPNGLNYTVEGRRIFCALGRIASTFVTTNYDRWLDKVLTDSGPDDDKTMPEIVRTIVCERELFSPEQLLQRNTVIQLHGRCTDKSSMVISTPHYVQHYRADRLDRDDENRVLTLLRALFRDKCVLFVGYGMSEMEILEYAVQKGQSRVAKGASPGHFVLFGFDKDDTTKGDLMDEYFASFGIGLLRYPIEGTHHPIADVLERMAETMPLREPVEAEVEYEFQKLGEEF